MKTITKKIIAILSLLLILLTSLPTGVFATYINSMNSNARFGVIQGSLDKYGHELHYANYDGQTYIVFCTQYGITSPSGGEYLFNKDFNIETKESRTEYEKIAQMIYFGYTSKYGTGIPTSDEAGKAACATQQYVWEYINDNINASYGYPGRDSWNSGYMSSAFYDSWLRETETALNNYYNNHVSFNETTGEIDIGDEVYYTDDNGVLANFDSFTKEINGVVFSHEKGSNQLKVTVPIDCDVTSVTFDSNKLGLHRLMPNGQPYDESTMSNYSYFRFSNESTQDLFFSNYAQPINFVMNFKIQSATLSIIKKDSETGAKPQGDATFTNAQYEVYAQGDIYNRNHTKKYYSNGDLVATRNMDANGKTEDITKLPLGQYRVKEKNSSQGYLIDSKEYIVNLTKPDTNTNIATGTATSLEVVKKMQVHIFKSGIKENSGETPGLEGAEFTIKLNRQVEEAYSKGYTYAEIWNGIDEKGNSVEVDSNRVKKAQTIAPSYEVITTDSEGNAYTKNKLPYGKYITKETKTPKDFESASDFTFSITQDESEIGEVAKKVKDIVVNNEQMEAYIKLVKKDLKSQKTVTLNSATFKITAKENIYDRATNKIIYKAGETVTQKVGSSHFETFTTTADGMIVPKGGYSNKDTDEKGSVITPLKLPVGKYQVEEITIPKGFLQLDKPVEFYVSGIRDYDQDQDEDFIKIVNINNEQPTGALSLFKTVELREDVDTSLVDISDLSGIKFKLTAKEDIIDYADGSAIYKKGQEVGTYNLTENGELHVQELPMGKYALQEVETLDGLVLDDKVYDIEFTKKDNIVKVYSKSMNIENETTLVEISKTSITTSKELEGANMSVLDKNGKIIDEWTSTTEAHKIEGLKVGETYTLKEELAPDGYVKSLSLEFTVENTSESQKVEMIDKQLVVKKTDFVTGEEVEGAKLKVTDKEGNVLDEWTSTTEEHIISGLEEGETYTLSEETCPYGYEVAENIEFTVTSDKEVQLVEMKDMPILKNAKVVKVDSQTKETIKDKFKFGIYEDKECTKLIKELQANKEDGFITFEDLRYTLDGAYYIKETEAPKGYELSDRVVKVEINDKGIFVDDAQVEEKDKTFEFTYENKKIEIPNTGASNYGKIALIIAIISLVAGASIIISNRKRKNDK